MIPSVLSNQLRIGLKDYIDTTFQITTPLFKDTIINLLDEKNKVFREPYVSVRLPFRKGSGDKKWFEGVNLNFPPYVHQENAFSRLRVNNPRSTLIATGTGSGKTECFLYPVLEYCYKHRGESGIKAIIVYPMNALATDQARRLAKEINSNPNLKSNVRAAMFVGDKEKEPSKVMSEDKIITDRDMIKEFPPDILLTNYKMLDYLLVRPDDAKIWKDNNSQTLKFIVVDELHTFDGAQGTDLAALIRRIKSRLGTPLEDYLCCVGTSATMGNKDQADLLLNYASNIFGETFEKDSIITEDRLNSVEYLDGVDTEFEILPTYEQIRDLKEIALSNRNEKEYVKKSIEVWYGKSYSLEELDTKDFKEELLLNLKKTRFFREVIEILNSKSFEYSYVYEMIKNIYGDLGGENYDHFVGLLDSILAMISFARVNKSEDLHVEIQFWFRELRRMLAKVSENVVLDMADDLNDEQKRYYLPAINCRECGATGWVYIQDENKINSISVTDLRIFYNTFFSTDKNRVRMLFPINESQTYEYKDCAKICTSCMSRTLNYEDEECSNCGSTSLIEVYIPLLEEAKSKKGTNKGFVCPCCNGSGGLSLIGAQSSTLISAGISEIFASKFNDDKKLLTFSDSVQDASHKAGFFNSRTWKFNLRVAIQKFIQDCDDDLVLSDFVKRFNQYWLGKLGKEGYVATFIPPDLTWRREFENMVEKGILGSTEDSNRLIDDVKSRVELEIYYEYGFNSRIGRTLEKSNASMLSINKKDLESAIKNITVKVQNDFEELRTLNEEQVQKLVLGLLIKMKENGALYKAEIHGYIKTNGNSYMLSNKHIGWMKGFSYSRTPKFLSGLKMKKQSNFDVIVKNSWYENFFKNTFEIPTIIREDLGFDVYKVVLTELRKNNILKEIDCDKGNKLYGINDDNVLVTSNVMQLKCDKCNHKLSVPSIYKEESIGMHCFRAGCEGEYEYSNNSLDFYGKLYSNGDVYRVFAKEHTGLLEREPREKVEGEFKKKKEDQKLWDTNILSCTPTLEMGIDIGDLSTVILCSVPPGQAQYQQRVGRAGRRDHNALNIVVANSKPHDLYFYEDPSEMISGLVEPPAIFLDASAVLERQLTAYCFDCWVDSGNANVPSTLDKVLSKLASEDNKHFPYNLLDYIDNNLSFIYKNFLEIFKDKLSEESKKELKLFAFGEGDVKAPLTYKIVNAFTEVSKERESIKKDLRELTKAIKKLENGVQDLSIEDEKKSLEIEKSALKNLVASINSKNIFNFLSDEGLLPNYAFPEAGVTLKAIIYRRKSETKLEENESTKKYENLVYEYNRSAVAAIQELAPENSFYAEGRKLKIDQIDLRVSEPQLWRLCPNCSHAELEISGKNTAQCPRCGSPLWADKGQVKTLLKLKMVYSNDEYAKSKSGDESDDREQKFFCKQMLVDIDSSKDIANAYKIDEEKYVFGFEFINKATLREINFGEIDNIGTKLTIAGREEVRKGFKVCKYCGKVMKKDFKHAFNCAGKNKPNQETEEESLYLYREFTSEAVRMLIPSTNIDKSETKLQSFVAAIMLGLKKHFGNVDHLNACVSEEPVNGGNHRKNYLVIYDTVPGGTGYLKQIMQSKDNMMEVFEKAFEALTTCNCNNNDSKDGCYRCLYAYRQSRYIGEISSKVAKEMLSDILKNKDNIQQIGSISEIKINSLFDSELEKRFIEALARSSSSSTKVEIEHLVVNNKPGYRLIVNDKVYEIEPQVDLGQSEGIDINSRPDFIIRPVKDDSIKPIAIFTDGFEYHKDIIDLDMKKRKSIVESGNYNIWSLTWKDIESTFEYQGDYYNNYLDPNILFRNNPKAKKFYIQLMQQMKVVDKIIKDKNNFELLIEYLAGNLNDETINKVILGNVIATSIGVEYPIDKFKKIISNLVADENIGFSATDKMGINELEENNTMLKIYSAISTLDITLRTHENALFMFILDDLLEEKDRAFEKVWIGYLKLYNIMQFKKNTIFRTLTGINDLDEPIRLVEEVDESNLLSEEWEDVTEYIDEDCIWLMEKLYNDNVIIPTCVGYELEVDDEVVGEAEVVWEVNKVAIITYEQIENANIFEQLGWKIFISEELKNDIKYSKLIESLK